MEQQYTIQKSQYEKQQQLLADLPGNPAKPTMPQFPGRPFGPLPSGPLPSGPLPPHGLPPWVGPPPGSMSMPLGSMSIPSASLNLAPGLVPPGSVNLPMQGFAAAGLDTNGDGRPNVILAGPDLRGDGLPDAMGLAGPLPGNPATPGFNMPPHIPMQGVYQQPPSIGGHPGLPSSWVPQPQPSGSWVPQPQPSTSWVPQPPQQPSTSWVPQPGQPQALPPHGQQAVPGAMPPHVFGPPGSAVLHAPQAAPLAPPNVQPDIPPATIVTQTGQGPPISLHPAPGAPPTGVALAGLDTNGDGHTNVWYVGADRRGDGIPDALEATGPTNALATMSLAAGPRPPHIGSVAAVPVPAPAPAAAYVPIATAPQVPSPAYAPTATAAPVPAPAPGSALTATTMLPPTQRHPGVVEQASVPQLQPVATSASPDRCVCGNVFAADALYCRHCGRKRPQPASVPTACANCGNTYMADSEFCRKCGAKRQR